ncbi:MAG: DNA polymerase III subunit gamma/tau [Gemmataceae bacterium]|nr:DNA polymerase III subunit gamma/tau [Gemmataceae bacterium]
MAKAKPAPPPPPAPDPAPPPAEYTVVARRYRPQQFADLIGQDHVAQALTNALQTGRVAHAYLFTGARGVGKTSAARILAKALNCVTGPTPTPCDRCESCLAIAAGQDVDVVEIDGASNNGVNDIRELRQNVGFLPTRSRYKVYIIDEVHMLSTGAFNALLKTLEEPPPHVKFIFATTEVQKLPITILSRCQRFDFAHVRPTKIFDQLKRIVGREGHQADDEALRLVARRAAGSMRDSQSLLDQLLASSQGKLTAEHVHAVLGTAGDDRVLELAGAVLGHDPKAALNLLAGWIDRGVQPGELLDQLTDYWRGLMLAGCGGDLEELPISPTVREVIRRQAGSGMLDTVLAGLDVLTTAKARMRGTGHTQVLLEMAIVRLARLDELLGVGALLRGGAAPPDGSRGVANDPSKKNGRAAPSPGLNGHAQQSDAANGDEPIPFTPEMLNLIWGQVGRIVGEKFPFLGNHLKFALSPAIFGPNTLVIRYLPRYNQPYEACASEANIQRLQDALRAVTGQPVAVRVELAAGPDAPPEPDRPAITAGPPAAARRQQLLDLPLIKKAREALGAQVTRIDDGFLPAPQPRPPAQTGPDADTPDAAPEED